MEHLRRIIPKIGVLHGLPGTLSMQNITVKYIKYLAKSIEKYRQLYTRYEACRFNEHSKYSLFARPHLPREIIEEFRKFVPNLKNIKIEEFSGLYKYVLRNYTHIPEIDKNLVSLMFEGTLEEVKCIFTEGGKPVDISIYDDMVKDLLPILVKYRNYKILDHYLTVRKNKMMLDVLTIPLQFIEEYAKHGGGILKGFSDKAKIYIELCQFVRGVNIQLAGGPSFEAKIPKIIHYPPFTYNTIWHNFIKAPTDVLAFWRIDFGENLAEYECFKKICDKYLVIRTFNLKVVQLALKIYPNKFRTIEWVFANFDFYPQKNEYKPSYPIKGATKNGAFATNYSKD